MKYKKLKSIDQKVPKQAEAKRDGVINPQHYNFNQFLALGIHDWHIDIILLMKMPQNVYPVIVRLL